MTNMEQALEKAGVPLPSKTERIWNWVKDHPDSTAREVSVALKLEQTTAGTLLAQLTKRKMLQANIRFGDRGTGRTRVNIYRTIHPTFADASNKSIPLKWKDKGKDKGKYYTVPSPVTTFTPPVAVSNVERILNAAMDLSIREFIELRQRLDEVFGKY